MSNAWLNGMEAQQIGYGIESNPYDNNTEAFFDWEDGYVEGMENTLGFSFED